MNARALRTVLLVVAGEPRAGQTVAYPAFDQPLSVRACDACFALFMDLS